MKILFALLGLYFGAVLDSFNGALFGAAIGLLAGALINANSRFRQLEQRLDVLERGVPQETAAAETETTPTGTAAGTATAQPATAADAVAGVTPGKAPGGWSPDTAATARTESRFARTLRRLLFGGNLVVKVGVVVLFFGVAFLIKYASEQGLVPIELRLAGIAASAIVLLLFGWRLRRRQRGYALVIQGGGIGILYLTVFAAARLYAVLPPGLAFVLLVAMVLCSVVLALLQDARALAFFGTAGGFLAPVLMSTGQGSHVQLFAYYLLLNAGVLAVAWFRAWRELNLLGFVFTFAIGSLWGWRYYQPEYFASTEPFLVCFFLFYLAIPVLFARRQPPRLRGMVDGTLVFGVPLVAFALQSALVADMEWGAAWSAVAISALYLLLAQRLWQADCSGMRLLSEAFLALGVLFGSMAVPLALDGHWTAAVWSLEGAALVWIGMRQQRLYARVFGLLLQTGAAVAFMLRTASASAEIPLLNSACLGSVLISVAGLAVGYLYHRHRGRTLYAESFLPLFLMIWGLAWWLAAGMIEIDRFLPGSHEFSIRLLFMMLTAIAALLLGQRLGWPLLGWPPALLLPLLLFGWLWLRLAHGGLYPFANLGWLVWPAAFLAHFFILYRAERDWPARLQRYWHQIGFVFLVYILSWLLHDAVQRSFDSASGWTLSAWALLPFAMVILLPYLRRFLTWPLQHHASAYQGSALWPLWLWLVAWILLVCGERGQPAPLPYLPLLNPIELMQWLALLLLIRIGMTTPRLRDNEWTVPALLALVFIIINSMAARGVHFYTGVPFALDAMVRSGVLQTVISILWTLLSMIVMGLAARRWHRRLWFVGAGLLAIVVLKLFSVDLADIGAMSRIISFISVGVLILVIGYLAPVPPKKLQAAS